MELEKIMYRGKLAETNLPYNKGDWALGDLVKFIDGDDVIVHIYGYGKVNKKTVGRYTGFNDTDGCPIFEGDIVTLSFAPDTLYAVIWAQEQARFLFTDGETVEDFDDFYVFETRVVGNIYDNPDIAPRCEV